jgi:hypothetical protein
MNDTTRGIDGLVLRWIERALFVTGGVLALWCTVVAGRAYYYSHLGVPPPTRIAESPGIATPCSGPSDVFTSATD